MSTENNATKNFNETNRYLEFNLGPEHYAVPLLDVKEVIPIPETTLLPNGPAYFIGIMNLRGQIVSVIDLRKKIGIKNKAENSEEAVIITSFEDISIGLIVDSINKVLNIPLKEIKEIPEVQSQVNAKYILGVFQNEDRLSILLDLKSILNIDEIKKLSKKAA